MEQVEIKDLINDSELLPQEDVIDAIGVDKVDAEGREVTDKQLVEYLYADLEYEMMDMDLLVKPLEPVMVKKILTELDEKKNKNLKVGQLMHTKQITKEVQASYRKGVILAMGPNVNNGGGYNVSIGDTIVFPAALENRLFDLYRDSIIISKYDIKAKVK
jgi:co-chaperonin GroES (HSP10)